jgi:hypothetical protein
VWRLQRLSKTHTDSSAPTFPPLLPLNDKQLKIKPKPWKRKHKKLVPIGKSRLTKQRVEKSQQSFDEKDVWVCLCSISFRSLLELGTVHKDTDTHPFLFTIVMEGYSYGSITDHDDEDAEEQPMTATESGKSKSDQTRPDQTRGQFQTR